MALVSSAICAGVACRRPASLGRPTWPRPWPFLKAGFGLLQIEIALLRRAASSAFFCQTHIICAAFSSQRHARQQVLDALVGRQRRILVGRQSRLGSACGRDSRPPDGASAHQLLRSHKLIFLEEVYMHVVHLRPHESPAATDSPSRWRQQARSRSSRRAADYRGSGPPVKTCGLMESANAIVSSAWRGGNCRPPRSGRRKQFP